MVSIRIGFKYAEKGKGSYPSFEAALRSLEDIVLMS